MSEELAVYLANLRRELTEEEEENIASYFNAHESDNDDAGKEPTYGDDHEPTPSDQSDFGEDNAEPIPDPRFEEYVHEEAAVDIDPDESRLHFSTSVIEANRGEKYCGQGTNDKTIWWSMPSQTEKRRTEQALEMRRQSTSICTESFKSKIYAFIRVFPVSLVEGIALETNRKAKRVIQANMRQTVPKKLRYWQDTNADEIYAFIAIILYCGAEKANLVHAKDLFHKMNMPFYRAVMSLHRFEQLCRFLRFDDSRTRAERLRHDKLAPIRHVWTLFLANLTIPFIPSKELTVDEQLLSTRNRCSFRQYIPSKPGNYGIKIFWLVDATSNYPLAGEVYLGAQPNEQRSTGIARNLVMRLSDRYLDKGVNITMDNFFTSYDLAEESLIRNTTIVGTIRGNKPQLPKLFTSSEEAKKRGVFESVFCFSKSMQLVSFTTHSKKNVLLLSTAHSSEDVNPVTKKPQRKLLWT
ncbi:piggyBac transposable element-derived protein 4-like [Rhagoletis pomonella]|uniref:piggyBac transposable element-derived protein 4-like n=1 Tax=Rhagoletis pomonella TaxID=28610 RepID=UPI00177B9479|nr:piggyBac transposable element-derived protein 4-like [Rhagoletis pomonella]